MAKKKSPSSAGKKVALKQSASDKGNSSKKIALMDSSAEGKPKQQPLSKVPDQKVHKMPAKSHVKKAKPHAKAVKKGPKSY